MHTFLQSTKRLSSLLIFFMAMLLLNACNSQSGPTGASSTPGSASTAAGTVSAGTPQLTEQYEFTEQESGKTVTYTVTTRFTLILNTQKYPKENLQVSCSPAKTLGTISNLPAEAPPLYAVRYEAVQLGSCTIRNGTFLLTVKLIDYS